MKRLGIIAIGALWVVNQTWCSVANVTVTGGSSVVVASVVIAGVILASKVAVFCVVTSVVVAFGVVSSSVVAFEVVDF